MLLVPPDQKFYGRRKGRPLSTEAQSLLTTILPKVLVREEESQNPRSLFPLGVEALWLEIGFGGGEQIAAQAASHPNVGFIGAEAFLNGVVTLSRRIQSQKLSNIKIWPDDIRLLLPGFPDASFAKVFLLFPDPWPKLRHHKRRFVSGHTIPYIARILRQGGEFIVASDYEPYIQWTVDQLAQSPFFKKNFGDPLPTTRPDSLFPTRYEQKALAEGRTCFYLSFVRG